MKSLKIIERNKCCSKDAKKERRKGYVPGVIYGKGYNNFLFEVGDLELNSMFTQIGEHGVINVDLEGKNEKVLIKEVQKDPVTHKVIHLDLQEVEKTPKVTCEVPIVFKHEGIVNSAGGILQKEKHSVKIKCDPDQIPHSVEVDLSKNRFKKVMRVKDLNFDIECSVLDNLDQVISAIDYKNKFEEEEVLS